MLLESVKIFLQTCYWQALLAIFTSPKGDKDKCQRPDGNRTSEYGFTDSGANKP